MKKKIIFILEFIAFVFGKIFGVIYDYRFQQRVKFFSNKIFSYANAKQFQQFGKGACVAHNVVLVNPRYISIGDFSSVGERTVMTAWDRYEDECFTPSIIIGKNTSIGADCHFTAIKQIVLGNGVLLGKKITITDNSHGTSTADQLNMAPIKRRLISKGSVMIEDNVWIGDKATILPGVHIGRGAIVAANAVVTFNVPNGSVVAGNPAKIIKNMLVL